MYWVLSTDLIQANDICQGIIIIKICIYEEEQLNFMYPFQFRLKLDNNNRHFNR